MTDTPVTAPTIVPLKSTCRNSERSGVVAAVISPRRRVVKLRQSKPSRLRGKRKQHCEICYGPGGQGLVHPALMLLRCPPSVLGDPWQQDHQPEDQRHRETEPLPANPEY